MRKLVFVLLLAFATIASGQAYKWRDANGRVQYSDTPPPPGAKEVQQLRKPPTSVSAAPAQKPVADQDAEFRKRQVERQESELKQAKAAEDEQVRARNCEQAKSQLAGIESGARLVQLNAKGERIALEDSERERARQDAQRAVESWCK